MLRHRSRNRLLPLATLARRIYLWRQRRKARALLRRLSDHELHERGISCVLARAEAAKHFWCDWSPEWQELAARRFIARLRAKADG